MYDVFFHNTKTKSKISEDGDKSSEKKGEILCGEGEINSGL